MAFTYEEYEERVNKLLNPELSHADRTEILTEMKQDYGTVLTDLDDFNSKVEDLETKRQDLLEANSKLFRQLPSNYQKDEKQEKEEQEEERAKTITISELEGNG